MTALLAAIALLLGATKTQHVLRCGNGGAPAGTGALELSIWQEDIRVPSEHAILSIAARDGRFAMDLGYTPVGGAIGAPDRVDVYAYAPWQRPVRVGEVLSIAARDARWQGPPWVTGLTSRSGRPGYAAEYLVAGRARAEPALTRAFAMGGEVKLAREPGEGSRVGDVVDLPRPSELGRAYRTARKQAVAALGPCPPVVAPPASAP